MFASHQCSHCSHPGPLGVAFPLPAAPHQPPLEPGPGAGTGQAQPTPLLLASLSRPSPSSPHLEQLGPRPAAAGQTVCQFTYHSMQLPPNKCCSLQTCKGAMQGMPPTPLHPHLGVLLQECAGPYHFFAPKIFTSLERNQGCQNRVLTGQA